MAIFSSGSHYDHFLSKNCFQCYIWEEWAENEEASPFCEVDKELLEYQYGDREEPPEALKNIPNEGWMCQEKEQISEEDFRKIHNIKEPTKIERIFSNIKQFISNVKLSIVKKIRRKIANPLNDYKETCSANLILWAEFPNEHEWKELKDEIWSQVCEDSGYCGKCEISGRIENKHFKGQEEDLKEFPFPDLIPKGD